MLAESMLIQLSGVALKCTLYPFPIMAEGTLADSIVIEDCVVSSPVKIAMIGIRYTSLQCYSAWLYQHRLYQY